MTTSPTKRPIRAQSGFTLIELLMVLVIMGIMVVMIVPTVTGSDVARVRTATRGLMQMSRYARTMAILRQETLTLEISTDGTLRVAPGGGEASSPGAAAPAAAGGGGQASRMSEVETQRVFKQVRFVAELAEDRLDESEAGTELETKERDEETDENGKTRRSASRTVRVPYEGNGRCLPYRVKVMPTGTEDENQAADCAIVVVDRFGNAKVEDIHE